MRTERLAQSGLLGLVGSVVAAAAAFAVALVVGNALGTYGTGLFFQAVGVFTIASQVLRLGTNSGIVRTVSEQHAFGRRGEAWRTILIAAVPVAVLSTLVAAVLWWSAPWLAGWLVAPGGSEQFEGYLRLMAPFIPAGAVLAVLQMSSRMLDGIVTYTAAHAIAYPIARLGAVVLAVLAIGSAYSSFAAWLWAIPVWLVVAVALLARPFVQDWRRRADALETLPVATRRFWAFSSARAVGGSLEILLEWSDVLIVAALTSPAEAGVYAIVTRTVRAGQVVDHSMRIAVTPTISRLLARGESSATRALHTSVTRAMILISWPFYLTLAIMGPAILGLFGPGFESGAAPLVILAGAMMVASSAGMLQSIILQGGHSSWQVGNKSVVLAASVAFNLLLVPVLGIMGAAVTWAVIVLLDTAIAAWQVHRRMRVGPYLRPLVPAMAVPVIVFGVGLGVARLAFGTSASALIGGVIGVGLVYAAVLWVLRRRLGIESLWREAPGLRRLVDRSMQAG
ncbi:lipopolysaccharide biosynthesis protein [Agromyces sp. Marseille-P2726]|uniref:lipopolysaccharide biosynthesis protein n=1 Tax=Agromyces sp. Marseille-P2726 TaxID=2709132 RepID=UPI00156D5017|nr:lipopolysaccharide biosynthesis protein [Agromyces sp. Marseille-P2726]